MSARRAARAARTTKLAASSARSVQARATVEILRDPTHETWTDRDRYHEFMSAHGWKLPASERLGASTHPTNRRNHAAVQWARENGDYFDDRGGMDLHRLCRAGLYGDGRNAR